MFFGALPLAPSSRFPSLPREAERLRLCRPGDPPRLDRATPFSFALPLGCMCNPLFQLGMKKRKEENRMENQSLLAQIPTCSCCNGSDVLFDAYAVWDQENECFAIVNVMDKGHYCQACDGECTFKWN